MLTPLKDYFTHQERDLYEYITRNMNLLIEESRSRLQHRYGAFAPLIDRDVLYSVFEDYTRKEFPLSTSDPQRFQDFLFRTIRPVSRRPPPNQSQLYQRTRDPRGKEALPYPEVPTLGEKVIIEGRLF